jgi:hypothetical protein
MEACPDCGRAGALGLARRIVLPGDRRSDEIALEILACACGFKAIAVAEHRRRAALKDGASDRVGYKLPPAAVDLLAHLIERCPEPAEEYCRCPAHALLNRRDLRNQWNLLHSFAPFPGFAAGRDAAKPAAGFAYAPLDWTRNGEGYAASVGDRTWHLHPLGPAGFELTIGSALVLELDALPPFWNVRVSEQGGREKKELKHGGHGDHGEE